MKKGAWKTGIIFGLLSVCIACHKDDDKGISGIVKKVVVVEQSEGKNFMDSYTFFYNPEMQLSRIYNKYSLEKEDAYAEDTLSFIYAPNEVMIIKGWQMHHIIVDEHTVLDEYWESVRDTTVYTMENGRAKRSQTESLVLDYKYDATTGDLISVKNNYGTTWFTWQDGDILVRKEEWTGQNQESKYEYLPETLLNNANIDLNPLFSTLISGCADEVQYGFWAGILGNRCRHLISDKEDAEPLVVEQEDGYLTHVTGKTRHMTITYQ